MLDEKTGQEIEEINQDQQQEEVGGEKEVIVPEVKFYTAEELEQLHPTAIDLERVNPEARPIVDKTIKEYKSLQADHTRKSQELAELKKAPVEPDTYFGDSNKDKAFKDFLKDPYTVVKDINTEIGKLEAVIPDDGVDEYRKARATIAYWNGIKDEFQIKRQEVHDKQQQSSIDEAKLKVELGADIDTLIDHARSMGFTEKEFKTSSPIRQAVRNAYAFANPGKGKEVKEKPHKTATPSGQAGGGVSSGGADVFDPKLSTEERIAMWKTKT